MVKRAYWHYTGENMNISGKNAQQRYNRVKDLNFIFDAMKLVKAASFGRLLVMVWLEKLMTKGVRNLVEKTATKSLFGLRKIWLEIVNLSQNFKYALVNYRHCTKVNINEVNAKQQRNVLKEISSMTVFDFWLIYRDWGLKFKEKKLC